MHALHHTDCSTAHSIYFEDAADISPTLDSDFFYPMLTSTYKVKTTKESYSFCLKVTAGGLVLDVPSLVLNTCASSDITSSVGLVLHQSVMVGATEMRYKIPQYTNSDSSCPDVTKHEILNQACTALSTDFDNSGTLTLESGSYYGKLVENHSKENHILFENFSWHYL